MSVGSHERGHFFLFSLGSVLREKEISTYWVLVKWYFHKQRVFEFDVEFFIIFLKSLVWVIWLHLTSASFHRTTYTVGVSVWNKRPQYLHHFKQHSWEQRRQPPQLVFLSDLPHSSEWLESKTFMKVLYSRLRDCIFTVTQIYHRIIYGLYIGFSLTNQTI